MTDAKKIRLLRIAGLVVGLAAIGMTAYQVFTVVRLQPSFSLRLLRNMVLCWPRILWWQIRFIPQVGLRLTPMFLLCVLIDLAAIVLSVLLARSLRRSGLDWGVVAFVVPYVAPVVLVFVKPRRVAKQGLIRRLFDGAISRSSRPRTTAEKRCSHCGKEVPLSSRRGQRCPYCGVYWSDERVKQR